MLSAVTFVLILILPSVLAQYDLSGPIKCYFCFGKERNSTCADPIDEKDNNLRTEECVHGVCVKWTRYIKGELMMERTCSAKMTLNIMMTDGVCRTESNGNGYLCMCGKHLCNHGNSLRQTKSVYLISLILCVLASIIKCLS